MLEVWKAFSANKLTHSTAHYLMTVKDLLEERGYARVSDVADKMSLAKSTVSTQVKSLVEKGLLEEDDAHHLRLSSTGAAFANEVPYNRDVLRQFFEEILGVDAEIAEVDACKTEHLLSQETIKRLHGLVKFARNCNKSNSCPVK